MRSAVSKMSQVVGDDHDREPLLAQAPHECEHLLGLRDTESGCRLIEDDELLEFHSNGLRDRDRIRRRLPESVATGCRIELIVVTASRLQRLGRLPAP